MPRITWPLLHDKPRVQVEICLPDEGGTEPRDVLADTGAGAASSPFEILLHEDDCLYCGGVPWQSVSLEGAYAGVYPVYLLRVLIPALAFDQIIRAVGVVDLPVGFDGIACFPFLNRFGYGNFATPGQFGLEC